MPENSKTNEEFYDAHVAPELARLANLCVEREMSFVAAVEYNPGDIAETRKFTASQTWAMEMVALAISAMGNLDLLVFAIARLTETRKDLDVDTSMVLRVLKQIGDED